MNSILDNPLPPWTEPALVRLRDLLAGLYGSRNLAKLLVDPIVTTGILWDGFDDAKVLWHQVLEKLWLAQQMPALLNAIKQDARAAASRLALKEIEGHLKGPPSRSQCEEIPKVDDMAAAEAYGPAEQSGEKGRTKLAKVVRMGDFITHRRHRADSGLRDGQPLNQAVWEIKHWTATIQAHATDLLEDDSDWDRKCSSLPLGESIQSVRSSMAIIDERLGNLTDMRVADVLDSFEVRLQELSLRVEEFHGSGHVAVRGSAKRSIQRTASALVQLAEDLADVMTMKD